jgi:hypothetical protein
MKCQNNIHIYISVYGVIPNYLGYSQIILGNSQFIASSQNIWGNPKFKSMWHGHTHVDRLVVQEPSSSKDKHQMNSSDAEEDTCGQEQHDQDEDEEEVCGQLQHQSCMQGTNIM